MSICPLQGVYYLEFMVTFFFFSSQPNLYIIFIATVGSIFFTVILSCYTKCTLHKIICHLAYLLTSANAIFITLLKFVLVLEIILIMICSHIKSIQLILCITLASHFFEVKTFTQSIILRSILSQTFDKNCIVFEQMLVLTYEHVLVIRNMNIHQVLMSNVNYFSWR